MQPDLSASPARERPTASYILRRLRTETAEQHASLEACLPVLDPSLSRATYHALLIGFWGFYSPLERRLLDGPLPSEPKFNYHERLKTPKLVADLSQLGETPDSLARAPQCEDLPLLSTLAETLGCLYVVEGATLGGQIISRHAHSSFGFRIDSGASFFNGYGAETGAHWKATGAFLTAQAERLESDDAIVAGANATFQSLSRWLASSTSNS